VAVCHGLYRALWGATSVPGMGHIEGIPFGRALVAQFAASQRQAVENEKARSRRADLHNQGWMTGVEDPISTALPTTSLCTV
jgi:hypothetical protein